MIDYGENGYLHSKMWEKVTIIILTGIKRKRIPIQKYIEFGMSLK